MAKLTGIRAGELTAVNFLSDGIQWTGPWGRVLSDMNKMDAMPETALAPESLHQFAARADAPEFWPVGLQRWLAMPGLAGGVVALLFFGAVWLAAGVGLRVWTLPTNVVGEALFFALSLGLLMELAALIPRSAQGDLDALASELTLDDALHARLRAALLRYPAGDMAINAGVGALFGVAHVALTAPGWWALPGDPVAAVLAMGTIALWAMMAQTGSLLVANAQLFARLGRHAVRVEVFAPDRLRPFATAALRPMLLIMLLLAAYPLMLLGSEGLEVTSAIGPVATALLALAAVWVPLRGVSARIREARALRLAQIDAAIAAAVQTADRHGAPADPPRLEALLALRARAKAAPSLPIGLGGLGRGLVYLALPVATWGGKGFAEALLNRLF
ncbi:MAG: hypothetical protein JJU15_03545 [Pararhodobacter sp.]|nr:hypothetical protein [Pararhodobacter sp.]